MPLLSGVELKEPPKVNSAKSWQDSVKEILDSYIAERNKKFKVKDGISSADKVAKENALTKFKEKMAQVAAGKVSRNSLLATTTWLIVEHKDSNDFKTAFCTVQEVIISTLGIQEAKQFINFTLDLAADKKKITASWRCAVVSCLLQKMSSGDRLGYIERFLSMVTQDYRDQFNPVMLGLIRDEINCLKQFLWPVLDDEKDEFVIVDHSEDKDNALANKINLLTKAYLTKLEELESAKLVAEINAPYINDLAPVMPMI